MYASSARSAEVVYVFGQDLPCECIVLCRNIAGPKSLVGQKSVKQGGGGREVGGDKGH